MDNQYARVIADSVSDAGVRVTTIEVNFWRGILAEANTHRMISKNTSSTRAIPVSIAIKQLGSSHFHPRWTKAQKGMKANEPLKGRFRNLAADFAWGLAYNACKLSSKILMKVGVSKQYAGRILEPFQYTKAVWTATEWKNFLHLRCHEDAQPEIRDLAEKIRFALNTSSPRNLKDGEVHVPYYNGGFWIPYEMKDGERLEDRYGHTVEEALMISTSCCAQVSYRRNDDSIETAERIWKKLVPTDGSPVHASPTEHQCTPVDYDNAFYPQLLPSEKFDGKDVWSGNLRGWHQHRQTVPNNVMNG